MVVMMELLWWSAADQVMTRLEADPTMAGVLRSVRGTLGRLEQDPYEPRLRTRQFATEPYGQMRSTPVGSGDWHIMWQAGPGSNQITIAFIAEITL
jgi:hypothetical protein